MRLIDADRLKEAFGVDVDLGMSSYDGTMVEIMLIDIDECPTIDPVHAAGGCYCQECKHYHKTSFSSEYVCRLREPMCRAVDDFCSRGERRK